MQWRSVQLLFATRTVARLFRPIRHQQVDWPITAQDSQDVACFYRLGPISWNNVAQLDCCATFPFTRETFVAERCFWSVLGFSPRLATVLKRHRCLFIGCQFTTRCSWTSRHVISWPSTWQSYSAWPQLSWATSTLAAQLMSLFMSPTTSVLIIGYLRQGDRG